MELKGIFLLCKLFVAKVWVLLLLFRVGVLLLLLLFMEFCCCSELECCCCCCSCSFIVFVQRCPPPSWLATDVRRCCTTLSAHFSLPKKLRFVHFSSFFFFLRFHCAGVQGLKPGLLQATTFSFVVRRAKYAVRCGIIWQSSLVPAPMFRIRIQAFCLLRIKKQCLLKNRRISILKPPYKGRSGSRRSIQSNREFFKHESSSFLCFFGINPDPKLSARIWGLQRIPFFAISGSYPKIWPDLLRDPLHCLPDLRIKYFFFFSFRG